MTFSIGNPSMITFLASFPTDRRVWVRHRCSIQDSASGRTHNSTRRREEERSSATLQAVERGCMPIVGRVST